MSCLDCKNYSELREPKDLTEISARYEEGQRIYGYCFKQAPIAGNTRGYPVYIPDGKCEQYAKKPGTVEQIDGQISMF